MGWANGETGNVRACIIYKRRNTIICCKTRFLSILELGLSKCYLSKGFRALRVLTWAHLQAVGRNGGWGEAFDGVLPYTVHLGILCACEVVGSVRPVRYGSRLRCVDWGLVYAVCCCMEHCGYLARAKGRITGGGGCRRREVCGKGRFCLPKRARSSVFSVFPKLSAKDVANY